MSKHTIIAEDHDPKRRKAGLESGNNENPSPTRRLTNDDYHVGWICAISTEYVAAQVFLDEKHDPPDYVSPHDNNDYTLGRIGRHNVVIAVLPDGEYGISSAATVARDMLHSFPNVRIALMVGIGGGAPSATHDVRLGDVVVSAPRDGNGGVFQYDFGKTVQDQVFRNTLFLNQPPATLRTAVNGLKAHYEIEGNQLELTIGKVLQGKPRLRRGYRQPDPGSDVLYRSNIVHPANDTSGCGVACGNAPWSLVDRPERSDEQDRVEIHYGLIASANQLMKDANVRDRLVAEKDVLCFEMEAAGLMNHFPCLVIRGICDYSDSHKNKEWQGYAAMAAAAYAKDLLCRIAPNKIEAESRISDSLSKILETTSGTASDVRIITSKLDKEADLKILDWLVKDPYDPQESYISKRQPGTGQWFLDCGNFQSWIRAENQTLFCPGIPGAGKTFMSSIVVDHLRKKHSNSNIAYVYFNVGQQDQQTPEILLKSILRQLCYKHSPLPGDLENLYERHEQAGTQLPLTEVISVLRSIILSRSRTFIIIDALDECQNHNRDMLLSVLFSLQEETRLNILATSRPQEVETRFKKSLVQEIKAMDRDIEAYLDDQIALWEKLHDISLREIRTFIKEEIIAVADGMFLLATLHMNELQSHETEGDVRDAVTNLARSNNKLDEAYEKTMTRIQTQDDKAKRLAMQSLMWICCTKERFSINELLCALAVRPNTSKLDLSYCPSLHRILAVCAGLLKLEFNYWAQVESIDLVHKTTRDYFDLTQTRWFPNADSEITATCVTYLSANVFQTGTIGLEEGSKLKNSNPLFYYAAENWGHHAREAGALCPGVMEFLERSNQLLVTSTVLSPMFGPYEGCFWKLSSLSEEKCNLALCIAVYFGIKAVVHLLVAQGASIDLVNKKGRTLLHWASCGNRIIEVDNLDAVDRVKFLLHEGADVNAMDLRNQTPLHHASIKGHFEVARLLLDHGANIDATDFGRKTALHYASRNGKLEIVKLLLDRGAAVNAADCKNQTPLHGACRQLETVILLLSKRGAAVNMVYELKWAPIHHASMLGELEIVKVLLDGGAAVNAVNNKKRTLLHYACTLGELQIVNLLLKRGAIVDVVDLQGWTPLHCASKQGSFDIAELLLDQGANIEALDLENRTPLYWACVSNDHKILGLLLSRGACFDSMDKRNPIQLGKTILREDFEKAGRLLQDGINEQEVDR